MDFSFWFLKILDFFEIFFVCPFAFNIWNNLKKSKKSKNFQNLQQAFKK